MKNLANALVNPILIIISFFLTIIISFNIALLINAIKHPDFPPQVAGYSPLLMGETDESVAIQQNTFLISSKKEQMQVGATVAYQYWNLSLIGKVADVQDGRGIINLWDEDILLTDDNLIGQIIYTNLPFGQFLAFTQTQIGMVIFVVIPLVALIVMQEAWFRKEEEEEVAEEIAALAPARKKRKRFPSHW